MTTAQAASRLRIDASTVGKMIRRGLLCDRVDGRRLKLAARRLYHGAARAWRYEISVADVRWFNRMRKLNGV